MLTSRYAREVGAGFVTGEGRLTSQQTLAAAFRDAGYATGAFVSNPVLRAAWGFDHGFDVYDHELAPRILPGARTVRERVAESTTARALDWVGEVRDRPFLLWVHYQDPHGPYGAPEPFAGRFRVPPWPGDRPLRHLKSNVGTRGVPLYQVLEGLVEPAAYRSRYADEVHYADHWVGTLWASLEAHASGRDTVWLFTSDHGEALGEDEHYFLHEVTTTPELAHVPFLVRAPGLAPGRHRDPVGHVDVLPTLLELAGLPVPEGLRGTALGPLLREGRPFPDRSLLLRPRQGGLGVSTRWLRAGHGRGWRPRPWTRAPSPPATPGGPGATTVASSPARSLRPMRSSRPSCAARFPWSPLPWTATSRSSCARWATWKTRPTRRRERRYAPRRRSQTTPPTISSASGTSRPTP